MKLILKVYIKHSSTTTNKEKKQNDNLNKKEKNINKKEEDIDPFIFLN